MCITNHPGFDAICLNRWVLELATENFKTRGGQKYRQVDSKERSVLISDSCVIKYTKQHQFNNVI